MSRVGPAGEGLVGWAALQQGCSFLEGLGLGADPQMPAQNTVRVRGARQEAAWGGMAVSRLHRVHVDGVYTEPSQRCCRKEGHPVPSWGAEEGRA